MLNSIPVSPIPVPNYLVLTTIPPSPSTRFSRSQSPPISHAQCPILYTLLLCPFSSVTSFRAHPYEP
ncbi:MAG: hypothetical protein F6J93_28885 [Oscillatoria sp. SIO1A7]|nr:hypothetical protein [Oscillatoria sp. SIO1A7]